MSLHREIAFETEICDYLGARGWLYCGDTSDAAGYDKKRALFPPDVLTWVKESQPAAWETLEKNHGAGAEGIVLDRLRSSLDQSGTLEVLRRGIDLIGLKQALTFAQFKPALGMNPDILARYNANRLRVVRQVRYSLHNENSIDIVLFLNGIPIATAELKSDFTQSVEDAVDQYRFDRDPKPRGQGTHELLLTFPSGALVHFAVSNSEVRMTTRLAGGATRFLPFNLGDEGGAGNPVNPKGHKTAYLWEQVWERESWLEILGRYLVGKKNDKKQLVSVLFPRYHQLDATRKLVATIKQEGAGSKFLIQHSAGSGKTNSIAWTAHFLADLHNEKNEKVFDTVLVVSDRTVLDTQLQEAIFDFERTTGVVATIKGESNSKSGELARALAGGKKIVVCTLQTFPYALKEVQELTATQGKRFAVIADEAHSSQTGQAATSLKQVLSSEEQAELADGGEIGTEDILAAQMARRASATGVTYIAFTATPKPKTLELFGRIPDGGTVPVPFHVYSMRQAIEEGFILDVLQNYTSYKVAFKLAHNGKEIDETEVERSAALKGILQWVRLHPYNISQKVQVVVEHFRDNIAPLLGGQAKAMVVTASRKEAVRWKLAMDKYIQSNGYKIGALVAFSGEVNDEETSPDPFTETGKAMNPTLKGRDIRDAFNTDEFQILLVANKFQTGFDQPLLCGMYVDKRLAGIQAVQTLSRLNRAHPGKDTTYILDFVNEPAEILTAFKTYHTTATLESVTDPNIVFNLRNKLDANGYYDDNDIERVVKVELNPNAKQSDLVAAILPVVDRLIKRFNAAKAKVNKEGKDEMDALVLFKGDLGAFLRLYSFLSQIFDYGNTDIEKRAIFYRRLLPLLEFGRERETIDLSQVVLTHHNLKNKGKQALNLGVGDTPTLQPITEVGSGQVREKENAYLTEIIEKVNDLFQGELTDGDRLTYVNQVLRSKLLESPTLVQQARNNTKEQFANSPDLTNALTEAIMDALEAHNSMSTQALGSEEVRRGILDILLSDLKLYEALRAQSERNNAKPDEKDN